MGRWGATSPATRPTRSLRVRFGGPECEDVQRWVDRCLVCLKARSRPRKVEAGVSRCFADHCWQEVSVDFEGPNREDRWGFRYTLTYLDCLSHAVLVEPVRSLSHAEVRRAFGKCIFRSRTLPTLVRSDRGTEFKNAMMAEFLTLLNVQQKFSTAMRPCEMGANERMHQEVQKVLHVILRELANDERSFPFVVTACSFVWLPMLLPARSMLTLKIAFSFPATWMMSHVPQGMLFLRTRPLMSLSLSGSGSKEKELDVNSSGSGEDGSLSSASVMLSPIRRDGRSVLSDV